MSHTYTSLTVHVVFSTRNRIPYLVEDRRNQVFAYMGGILRNLRCEPLHVNGYTDHAHVVMRMPAALALSDVVSKLKANSSKWIHEAEVLQHTFAWQHGYSAFSVSQSNLEGVERYVANQKAHHQRRTFPEELLELLKRHAIDYDERYLWD